MKSRMHAHRRRLWAAIGCAALALAAFGALDEDDASTRHVGVNVYAGSQLERIATGIIVGEGIVLTDAETLAEGRRYAVVAADGAEMAASVAHANQAMSLAVLEVAGLDQPAVSFARNEVTVDEDRFVHAVAFDPAASDPAKPFLFQAGSIGDADTVVARRGNTPVAVYEHNARVTAVGFGGSLLNNCGELVGINRPDPEAGGLFDNALRDPAGIAFASRIESVETQLDEWEVAYSKSDDTCVAEAAQAEATALEKAEQAEQALAELEQARQRHQELEDAAAEATEAGDAARAEAEAAQREAETAVEAAESLQRAAEAEAAAARQAAEAEAAKLQQALADAAAERQRLQGESRTVATIAGIGVLALTALIVLLLVRSRQKSRMVAVAASRSAAAERELEEAQGGEFPDCLLEGSDDEGKPFALKIPGSALRAGVDGIVLGRSPERAEFMLDHPSISRAHCRLYRDSDTLRVEDLHATNGVLLNGETVEPGQSRSLQEGDTLTLGAVKLTLRLL